MQADKMGVSRCIQLKKGVLPGLFLIPDITGFTKYIAAADLQYSQVNIAILLEAILENNKLGLQVSEIEGDAILFYSFENDHSVGNSRSMFFSAQGISSSIEENNCNRLFLWSMCSFRVT